MNLQKAVFTTLDQTPVKTSSVEIIFPSSFTCYILSFQHWSWPKTKTLRDSVLDSEAEIEKLLQFEGAQIWDCAPDTSLILRLFSQQA